MSPLWNHLKCQNPSEGQRFFQTEKELIANGKTVEFIREQIGVDSLGYLSLEGMLSVAPNAAHQYCTACFTQDYPIQIENEVSKLILER